MNELEPAGVAWCARFPTSKNIADLTPEFAACVRSFFIALVDRGCKVHVSATYRPEPRAWLMHWAWMLDREGANEPPKRPDIPILWTMAGANEMVAAYELEVRPSLDSRHIHRRAIDMTITGWPGHPGPGSKPLYGLGAIHGVHKLVKDPPHWSDDGH